MTKDYRRYKLNKKERLKFMTVSYTACAFLGYMFYKNLVISLAVGIMCIFTEKFYCEYLVEKRNEKLMYEFKDLMYSLSSSVAAGRYMNEALQEGEANIKMIYGEDSILAKELELMNRSISHSRASTEDVLEDFAERSANEDIKNFVEVFCICKETGSDLQKVISSTVSVILDKMQMQKEIKTMMAQKQFEARIVSVMPVGIIVFLNMISPEYLAPLYEGILGRLIMTFALAGFAAAAIWMFKLTGAESI